LTRPALLALTYFVFPVLSLAQIPNDGPPLVRTTAQSLEAAAGAKYRVVSDPVTGNPAFVYGARIALARSPRTLNDFETASRELVAQFPDLFGIASNELVLDEIRVLPLSRIGSSDKIAATFRQEVDGIAVLESSVTFLFDAATSDLLAIDQQTVPGAGAVALTPRSNASEAIVAAEAEFARRFGIAAVDVDSIEPVIIGPSARFDAATTLPDRGPTLAYRIVLANRAVLADGAPADAELIVSAEGDLTVFRFERLSFTAIGGTVRGNVNIGPEPNTTTNQEQPVLEFVHIRDAATNAIVATTDANGVYSIASDTPFNGYLDLNGQYCSVVNKQGANARLDFAFAGPSTVNPLFNPTKAEATTAEVSAFYWTNTSTSRTRATPSSPATRSISSWPAAGARTRRIAPCATMKKATSRTRSSTARYPARSTKGRRMRGRTTSPTTPASRRSAAAAACATASRLRSKNARTTAMRPAMAARCTPKGRRSRARCGPCAKT
jgi:hypothetical protein